MRTTNASSNPLQFSVLSRTRPDEEPTVVGVCEQDDVDDGFLVTVTLGTDGHYSISLTEQELQTLGRCIQQRFGDQDPLIGQFFHTLKDGKIEKQGHIGGSPQPGYYVVTFFSGLEGEKIGSKVIQFRDMIEWTFFDDEEQWRAAGEHMTRQREGRCCRSSRRTN